MCGNFPSERMTSPLKLTEKMKRASVTPKWVSNWCLQFWHAYTYAKSCVSRRTHVDAKNRGCWTSVLLFNRSAGKKVCQASCWPWIFMLTLDPWILFLEITWDSQANSIFSNEQSLLDSKHQRHNDRKSKWHKTAYKYTQNCINKEWKLCGCWSVYKNENVA